MTILMVSYLACLSLCLHTHVVDSKVITHSHPYKTTSHTHSGTEIVLFDSLSNIETLNLDNDVDFAPAFTLFCELFILYHSHIESFYLALSSLRAPPVSFF